jgi:hypothetical protein
MLEWTGALKVYDFTSTPWEVSDQSATGLNAEGDALWLLLVRTDSEEEPTVVVGDYTAVSYVSAYDDASKDGEGVILVAVRDADGNLVFRDGTVLAPDQWSPLGTPRQRGVTSVDAEVEGAADYADILDGRSAREGNPDESADAVDLGVTYPVGSSRLVIYRDGRRLEPDYASGDFDSGDIGTFPEFEAGGPRGDYHEVDAGLALGGSPTGYGTTVMFYAGYEPEVGDRLQVFVE